MAVMSSFSIVDGKYDDDGRIKRTGLYLIVSSKLYIHQLFNEHFLFIFHFYVLHIMLLF
jgi:hypothetical protein